jgi:hypothetical protein
MILRLLKGRGMVSGLFDKKRDAIPPHLKQWVQVMSKEHLTDYHLQIMVLPHQKQNLFHLIPFS